MRTVIFKRKNRDKLLVRSIVTRKNLKNAYVRSGKGLERDRNLGQHGTPYSLFKPSTSYEVDFTIELSNSSQNAVRLANRTRYKYKLKLTIKMRVSPDDQYIYKFS